MERTTPRFLVAGKLSRDFLLFPNHPPLLDVPGGNALYAAVGIAIWEPQPPPAVIARVGEDYPQQWLDNLTVAGMDMRAVRRLPETIETRFFAAILDAQLVATQDPVAHFARLGLPYPKALLGYEAAPPAMDSRTRWLPTSLRQSDIPAEFMDVGAIHFCPLDFLTHSLLPALLRQAGFTIITVEPSPGYMNAAFFGDVPSILVGLSAFLPDEASLRALFQGRTADIWEMIEALGAYNCEVIVVKTPEGGQYLYDVPGRRRWEVPPYPARRVNPLGVSSAFCGGFLAGYRRTYDPLEATLYGNISASLVVEGCRATYALEALPGLAQARLEALRAQVRAV